MRYRIDIWGVNVCSIWFDIDKDLANDSDKLTEQQIDLIIKDALMQNLRESKHENFIQLLSIIQDAFSMYASMELAKIHKWEALPEEWPSEDELKALYKEFLTHQLRLTPDVEWQL